MKKHFNGYESVFRHIQLRQSQMTIRTLYMFFFAIVNMTSCGKTIKLAEKDLHWIPYKGNETLVFNSNAGESDTIFLTGSGRSTYASDPLDFFPTKLESFGINSKRSDPSPPDGQQRYLESGFVEISTSEDNTTYMTIDLTAKDAWFYGGRFMLLKDLDTVSFISLPTKLKTYEDILVWEPESNEYFDRSNFITKVYWSKSEGLVRFDKKDSVYWELAKKY